MMVNNVGFAPKTAGPKAMGGNKNAAALGAMGGNGNSGGTGGAKPIHMAGYGFPGGGGKGTKMGQTTSTAPAMKKFMKDMSKSPAASGAASAAGAQGIHRPR